VNGRAAFLTGAASELGLGRAIVGIVDADAGRVEGAAQAVGGLGVGRRRVVRAGGRGGRRRSLTSVASTRSCPTAGDGTGEVADVNGGSHLD
jgi:hypothetical protein